MSGSLADLIHAEGWEIEEAGGSDAGSRRIVAYGERYPVTHPCLIHLKRYRLETIPELRYQHMKAAHDYLWPQDIATWHYWTEERFREHCAGWQYMSWAGCASSAKSYDAAKVTALWWWANPRHRAAMIASTTLLSMTRRVWGYLIKLLSAAHVRIGFDYLQGNSPQILNCAKEGKPRDTLHGIMACAAKQGDDSVAISNFIGTHPDESMMLILDEAPELPVALMNSIANLKSTEKPFQLIAIGNSNRWDDLHGALSTPAGGINSIDPYRDTKWLTTQQNGVCLYFNAYNSPAIHEVDSEKRAVLSKFLATRKSVEEAEAREGKDSPLFWRFTLGFWQLGSTSPRVMSEEFMKPFNITEKAHWLGIDPLIVVAGMDVAFSTGGDKCILQLGYLGQTIDGRMVLDFRGNDLCFHIKISAASGVAAELQIAEQTKDILSRYYCPLHHMAIDASGLGRAVGSTIQLYMKAPRPPLKIVTVRQMDGKIATVSFDSRNHSRSELWETFRTFVEHKSICGVNGSAHAQLTSRMFVQNPKTLKRELESKKDYKARLVASKSSLPRSPDEADAATLCLQSAIENFGFYAGQLREVPELPSGYLAEIQAWKESNKVKIETQDRRDFPTANFSSGELKRWGSI